MKTMFFIVFVTDNKTVSSLKTYTKTKNPNTILITASIDHNEGN